MKTDDNGALELGMFSYSQVDWRLQEERKKTRAHVKHVTNRYVRQSIATALS